MSDPSGHQGCRRPRYGEAAVVEPRHPTKQRQEDLFKTDFSTATVVTLFLFPELNERLAPRLRSSLRPGSRIVAYQFGIPGWAPDEQSQLNLDGNSHNFFLWRMK